MTDSMPILVLVRGSAMTVGAFAAKSVPALHESLHALAAWASDIPIRSIAWWGPHPEVQPYYDIVYPHGLLTLCAPYLGMLVLLGLAGRLRQVQNRAGQWLGWMLATYACVQVVGNVLAAALTNPVGDFAKLMDVAPVAYLLWVVIAGGILGAAVWAIAQGLGGVGRTPQTN